MQEPDQRARDRSGTGFSRTSPPRRTGLAFRLCYCCPTLQRSPVPCPCALSWAPPATPQHQEPRGPPAAYLAKVMSPTLFSGLLRVFEWHTMLTASCWACRRVGRKSPFLMYSLLSTLAQREGGVSSWSSGGASPKGGVWDQHLRSQGWGYAAGYGCFPGQRWILSASPELCLTGQTPAAGSSYSLLKREVTAARHSLRPPFPQRLPCALQSSASIAATGFPSGQEAAFPAPSSK